MWAIAGAVRPVGAGHINDTFVVDRAESDAGPARYVLQRVNRFVFDDPEALMRNLNKVRPSLHGMTVAPLSARDGRDFWTDPTGDLWRLYPYVEHRSFENLPDRLVRAAGAIFGSVLQQLANVRVDLEPVIEGFHDIDHYLVRLDGVRLAGTAAAELAYVDERRSAVSSMGGQPQVIHGDCKISNILFDPDVDEARYVVDLDTLMLGQPSWDYGDLVRSVCAGAEESRAAQGLVMPRVESVTNGFFGHYAPAGSVSGVGGMFGAAPGHMSFMLGVRFLTDHLDGDRYFKVEYRGQNLDRARSQFDLTRRFDAKSAQIGEMIDEAMQTP